MNRRVLTMVITGGALVVAVWLFSNWDTREEEVYVGFSGEARRNPLLAAGILLRRMGYDARDLPPVQWTQGPPRASGVFVLASQRGTLTRQRSQALLRWIEQGGHLITVPRYSGSRSGDGDAHDPLLDALGISVHWRGQLEDDAEGDAVDQALRDGKSEVDKARWSTVLPVTFPRQGSALQAEFPVWTRLGITPDWSVLASDARGACLLHAALGNGLISVLCDPAPLLNDAIAEHDHAELLVRLVGLSGRAGPVWLVHHHGAMPALPRWLWHEAPEALLGFALVLLFAFWSVVRRFGPAITLEPLQRRQLVEHLESGGHFLWRHRRGDALLQRARAALLRFARRRVPGWETKAPAQRVKALADLLGVSETLARSALEGRSDGHRRRFLLIMRDVQKLRSRL